MSNKIIIRFQPKGDKALIAALRKLDKLQKQLEGQTKQTAGAMGFLGTQFKRNSKRAGTFALSLSTIRSKLLLVSFAASMGGRQLVRMAASAAKLQQMETAFNTLTGATENSLISLKKLQNATDGTVSKYDLLQQANNAMILGVTKSSKEMAEMFDIAQRLGKALGVDAKRSVESLITGIGRQSRLMLDNIGIVVKADEAYLEYAKKLKVGVKDLTDFQKKQAFLNATMEAAREKVSQLGPETETTDDIYQQLKASLADLAVVIGDILAPVMEWLSRFLKQLAEDLTTFFTLIGWIETDVEKLTSSLASQQAEWTLLKRSLEGVNEESEEFISTRDKFMKQNPNYFAGLDKEKIKVNDLKDAIDEYNKFLGKKLQIQIAELALEGKTQQIADLVKIKAERNLQAVKNEQKFVKELEKMVTKEADVLADIRFGKLENWGGSLEEWKKGREKVKTNYLNTVQPLHDTIVKDMREKGVFFKEAGQSWLQQIFDPDVMNFSNMVAGFQAQIAGPGTQAYQDWIDNMDIILSKGTDISKEKIDALMEELMADLGIMSADVEQMSQAIMAIFGIKFDPGQKDGTITDIQNWKMLESQISSISQTFTSFWLSSQQGARTWKNFGKVLTQQLESIVATYLANLATFHLLSWLLGGPMAGMGGAGKALAGLKKPTLFGFHEGGVIPQYHSGGSVDDVPIMAQEGEFMMRRSAVESIGLENLNRMNRTGQVSGANITFTGNIMSDSFIEEEAIPKIKDALRRGADLGIS